MEIYHGDLKKGISRIREFQKKVPVESTARSETRYGHRRTACR
jgi:hypothetical protein